MDYPDISEHIKTVAANYQFHKMPPLLMELQGIIHKVLIAVRDFLTAIKNFFGKVLPSSASTNSWGDFLQWSLYVCGGLAIILLIYMAGKKISSSEFKQKKSKGDISFSETILNSLGWKQKAQNLAQKADYRNACRALSLSALQYLDETSIAAFAPTKTNFEYAYLLASHPKIKASFRDLADLIEPIWYGYQSAESQDYLICLSKLNELEINVKAALDNQQRKVQ